MGNFELIILTIIMAVIGQFIYIKTKGGKVFYYIHLALLAAIILFSLIVTSNQSGGVHWPWWFFSLIYGIPVVSSLLFGFIRRLLTY